MIYLVVKNIVSYVVPLRRLWSQNEGLHEATHGLSIVRQLPSHLNDYTISQSFMRVDLRTKKTIHVKASLFSQLHSDITPKFYLSDLSMTVTEVEGLDSLVNFLLPVNNFRIPGRHPMNKRRVIRVEPMQVKRSLIHDRVVLPNELQPHEVNIRRRATVVVIRDI